MGSMDGWDVAMAVAAGYVAVTALIKLMTQRSDRLILELSEEAERERRRKEQQELEEQQAQKQAEAEAKADAA